MFALLFEDMVNQLALSHRGGVTYLHPVALPAQVILRHVRYINAGILFYGIGHDNAPVGSLVVYEMFTQGHLCGSMEVHGHLLQYLFSKLHHPDVVLIGHIDLHHRKLRVMGAVHPLVAEVFCKLVDSIVTAYYEALQVKLIRYAEVERYVEGIMVSHEWSCCGAAGDRLKHGCLHLEVATGVKELTHRLDYLRALAENLAHFGIDDQVNVTLAVAHFLVSHRIVQHPVLLLYYGQRAERLAEECQLLHMNGDFAHLGTECKTLHSDDVTNIQKLFKQGIVHCFILARAEVITAQIDLYAAR